MELSSHEEDIPIPISSTYGGGHGHGGHGHGHIIHLDHHSPSPHNHIIPSSAPHLLPSSNGASSLDHHDHHHNHGSSVSFKKMVRYKECLKNHAAAMGGNATDGCGEFMSSGEEGSIEALTCSACNCHRNFHRKEIEGETTNSCEFYPPPPPHSFNRVGRKLILGHHKNILGAPETLGYPTAIPHHQMRMSYNMGGSLASESDHEQEDAGHGHGVIMARPQQQLLKKRFRTKFTQEQKEKMLNFAEKVGWKIQKQEESVVQQFCQEIGVKRRVLKVWMHNNKHTLAKKNHPLLTNSPSMAVSATATPVITATTTTT